MRTLASLLLVAVVACGSRTSGTGTQSEGVVAVGAVAPAVTLTTTSNTPIALADTFKDSKQAIVVFYRGFY